MTTWLAVDVSAAFYLASEHSFYSLLCATPNTERAPVGRPQVDPIGSYKNCQSVAQRVGVAEDLNRLIYVTRTFWLALHFTYS